MDFEEEKIINLFAIDSEISPDTSGLVLKQKPKGVDKVYHIVASDVMYNNPRLTTIQQQQIFHFNSFSKKLVSQ